MERAGLDDSSWEGCSSGEYSGELMPSEGEKVTAHETFTPEVLHTPDGKTVLDFGQNISGLVSFIVSGKAGDTVKMIHGETLDEKGNFTVSNLGDGKVMKLGQEMVYVLKDGEQSYEPLFLICGFRYVLLESWPGAVKAEDFKARAVYSDLHFTGSFECSDEGAHIASAVFEIFRGFYDSSEIV